MRSDSVARTLDTVEIHKKVTGFAATVEITVYPDGHAAVAGHPVNHKEELMQAVSYLFDRIQREAESSGGPSVKA